MKCLRFCKVKLSQGLCKVAHHKQIKKHVSVFMLSSHVTFLSDLWSNADCRLVKETYPLRTRTSIGVGFVIAHSFPFRNDEMSTNGVAGHWKWNKRSHIPFCILSSFFQGTANHFKSLPQQRIPTLFHPKILELAHHVCLYRRQPTFT